MLDLTKLELRDAILKNAILALNKVLVASKVDAGHGLDHALAVLEHAEYALVHHKGVLSSEQKLAVCLAALLHDADDEKFFASIDNDNTRNILFGVLPLSLQHITPEIIRMINATSFRKNANHLDDAHGRLQEYQLIPRLADRLEAIGDIGIKRCLIYSDTTGRPRWTLEDLKTRPRNYAQVKRMMSKQKLDDYLAGKKSASAISHFTEKILFVCDFTTQTSNSYLLLECDKRTGPIYEFLISGDWNQTI